MTNAFSPIERGTTIAMLWLFAILNTLFRDIHELVVATTIEQILSGQMNGTPVTEMALFAGAFAVEMVLLAMVLSRLLKPIYARIMNLVVAPIAALGTFIVPPVDMDDHFFAVVVLATFTAIFAVAWTWQTQPQDTASLQRQGA
ncbi:MAG: DUF6326 family protein [Pseudomonadota bacterium]